MKDTSAQFAATATGIPDLVLNFIIPATNLAVRRMLHGLHLSLLANGVSELDMEHVEIVLAEVLNNIVEHAYADRPQGVIAMIARLDPTEVQIELTDSGAPMPNQVLPAGPAPTLGAQQDLPEGGFGWHLIRALTDRLEYERVGDQNRLTLHIPRSRAGLC